MDACQFYLFGPPHLIRSDQAVAIPRRKQWGLLAYLLLTRQPHERDTLAALLWPSYSQSRARADLRRELARLRHILPDVIACPHTEVALAAGATLWVDVWAFEEHLAAVRTHAHPQGAWCDACYEHLSAARSLYAGDLLAGYSLSDCPGFEEWHFFYQESLRSDLLDVLSLLAAMEMAGGNLAEAIAPLRARLAIDPLHEESHRRLIWIYAHTGQRAAALRQFGECKAALARDLGVEPAPETIALYRQLKALAPLPAAAQPLADASGPNRSHLPSPSAGRCFVGRERQLAELADHLDAACAGRGRVVFVSGEAGAGKTALLVEFSSQALVQHSDLVVTAGSATVPDPGATPLLPFRTVLTMLTGGFAAQGAAWQLPDAQVTRLRAALPNVLHTLVSVGPHLVGSLVSAGKLLDAARAAYLEDTGDFARVQALVDAHVVPPLTAPLANRAIDAPAVAGPELDRLIFAEAAAMLEELALVQPLLLLLDDFHWADAASLNLLFHLGKRLRTQPILIVCAYRPAELAPTAPVDVAITLTHHPLQTLIHELTRDFGPVQIDLDAEVPSENLNWVEALLAAQPGPEPRPRSVPLRDALFSRTHGQPLFTVELLDAWRTHGWLAYTGDRAWLDQHACQLDLVPPQSAAAIQRRLDRLSDDAIRLLLAAAALGETFSLTPLAAALEWSERRALAVLAGELYHLHHLVVDAGPLQPSPAQLGPDVAPPPIRYRFANPMIRTYLYEKMDAGERLLFAGKFGALGTPLGTPAGRTPPTLKPGRVDDQVASKQNIQPFCPLVEMTPSQRSVPMYHRWHLNYPILILILAILLAVWAVSYTVATVPGFNISSLWQQAPAVAPITRADMLEVAPGLYVPRDYYTQEKTYRAPVILVLAPGYQVPQGYFVQEKTYREPASVEVAPGFKVPLGYYVQEKMYHEEPTN